MATDRWASWLKGVLDLLVLAGLTEGESYGYEIAKTLADSGLGRIKGGTLYPVLNRLEEAGLVVAEFRVADRGPGRRYYTLMAMDPTRSESTDSPMNSGIEPVLRRWGAHDSSVHTTARPFRR